LAKRRAAAEKRAEKRAKMPIAKKQRKKRGRGKQSGHKNMHSIGSSLRHSYQSYNLVYTTLFIQWRQRPSAQNEAFHERALESRSWFAASSSSKGGKNYWQHAIPYVINRHCCCLSVCVFVAAMRTIEKISRSPASGRRLDEVCCTRRTVTVDNALPQLGRYWRQTW
jgi:hypothetical protein